MIQAQVQQALAVHSPASRPALSETTSSWTAENVIALMKAAREPAVSFEATIQQLKLLKGVLSP